MKGKIMLVGYARVSTTDQNLDLQLDALKQAGCIKIFSDMVSGARADRPGLRDTLQFMREGDVLTVWKLDRLGRTTRRLIEFIEELKERQIGFKCIQNNIDTTTSEGMFMYRLFSALAELERDLLRERTMAGLAAARARGRKGGGKFKLTGLKLEAAMRAMENPKTIVMDLAKVNNVSTPTLYRAFKRWKARKEQPAMKER
jgi:DNA invertase Pin-like site-specific DNA recombinase